MANSYKDLRVWKQSVDLALEIYRYTQDFPKHELYGLTSQLRRAAVSVSSNRRGQRQVVRQRVDSVSVLAQPEMEKRRSPLV